MDVFQAKCTHDARGERLSCILVPGMSLSDSGLEARIVIQDVGRALGVAFVLVVEVITGGDCVHSLGNAGVRAHVDLTGVGGGSKLVLDGDVTARDANTAGDDVGGSGETRREDLTAGELKAGAWLWALVASNSVGSGVDDKMVDGTEDESPSIAGAPALGLEIFILIVED